MKKCVIIGGGIAGLASAVYLTKNGIQVTLFELSPKLGGRAYSFIDPQTKDVIDNGQHILMGCYKDTINFLKLINAQDNFFYQKKLEINFLKETKKLIKLKGIAPFYPLNLFLALLNFRAIRFKDKISALFFIMKLPFVSHQKIANKSVKDWLIENKQSENAIKSLWEIICIGALNTNIKKASAFMFREILLKIFLNGKLASTIILPKYGLSESYVANAKEYILSNGGEIKISSPVGSFRDREGKIVEMKVGDESVVDFDFVISAVPFYSLKKFFPLMFKKEDIEFEYSSILNVHIWLKSNPLTEQFYGLIDSPIHWIFNKKSHLNLVISDADTLMDKTKEEIYNLCLPGLKEFTGIEESNILHYKVLKEKRATFIPSVKNIYNRPTAKTKFQNLFLAGDWTDTGLPSTLESAVKSGRIAAEYVINSVS
jgi:hydroxysqualene dehydroxylase